MKAARILIVDDDEVNVIILEWILKKNYHVEIAASGELALEMVFSLPKPDLILLDIMMPGMSGIDVCKKLKANPLSRNIPVLFVSAVDLDNIKTSALAAGGAGFINKPFSRAEILAQMQVHLEIANAQKDLQNDVMPK